VQGQFKSFTDDFGQLYYIYCYFSERVFWLILLKVLCCEKHHRTLKRNVITLLFCAYVALSTPTGPIIMFPISVKPYPCPLFCSSYTIYYTLLPSQLYSPCSRPQSSSHPLLSTLLYPSLKYSDHWDRYFVPPRPWWHERVVVLH
jgi:hypothetical protein